MAKALYPRRMLHHFARGTLFKCHVHYSQLQASTRCYNKIQAESCIRTLTIVYPCRDGITCYSAWMNLLQVDPWCIDQWSINRRYQHQLTYWNNSKMSFFTLASGKYYIYAFIMMIGSKSGCSLSLNIFASFFVTAIEPDCLWRRPQDGKDSARLPFVRYDEGRRPFRRDFRCRESSSWRDCLEEVRYMGAARLHYVLSPFFPCEWCLVSFMKPHQTGSTNRTGVISQMLGLLACRLVSRWPTTR